MILATIVYGVERARLVIFPLSEYIRENRPEQNSIVAAPSCNEITFRYLLKHTYFFLLY